MEILSLVYIANALWFGSAFVFFSLRKEQAVKVIVPREARGDRLVPTLTSVLPFLGGINGALSGFCFILAFQSNLFVQQGEKFILFLVLSLANLSQFAFNLPILLQGGRQGVAYWPVLKGMMLFIFIIDGTLALIDFLVAFSL